MRTALRCAFSWVETSLTRVVLRDLDAPGKMSLTNDVETVVDEISRVLAPFASKS